MHCTAEVLGSTKLRQLNTARRHPLALYMYNNMQVHAAAAPLAAVHVQCPEASEQPEDQQQRYLLPQTWQGYPTHWQGWGCQHPKISPQNTGTLSFARGSI